MRQRDAGEPSFMRTIRAILLSAACAALMWSAALGLFGGFKFRVLGVAIRSNKPDRALLIGCMTLAGYFIAGGRIHGETVRRLRAAGSGVVGAVVSAGSQVVRALVRQPGLVAAALALTLAITVAAGSTRIAGGADAYGYVSQADL